MTNLRIRMWIFELHSARSDDRIAEVLHNNGRKKRFKTVTVACCDTLPITKHLSRVPGQVRIWQLESTKHKLVPLSFSCHTSVIPHN
jgi:hypothetical protein